MADRYRDILVVDLLGGIGDLVMLLPAVHALARHNPGGRLRVLTHEPGADLIRTDPTVTDVLTPRHGRPGAEREAVLAALADQTPELAVTTTRYDGIADALQACGARWVTDLWRRPPPDEPVGARYLRILRDEGLLTDADLDARPRVHIPPVVRAHGDKLVAQRVGSNRLPPVMLVPDAGMAVKRWPDSRWRWLAEWFVHREYPVLTVGVAVPPATPLPRLGLLALAGCFAALADRHGAVVGADTGPVRLAAASGAATVGLFGPTSALRYGIGGIDLQGLTDCEYRQPTAITEQPCWWDADCPLSTGGPACMSDIDSVTVARAIRQLMAAQR